MEPFSEQKKICLFCGDITRCGGTERITILLANLLAEKPEYKVYLLSLTETAEKPFFPLSDDVSHTALFTHSFPFRLILFPAILRLRRFLKKEKITHLIDVDVILSAVSVFAVRSLSCRHISWEHFHFQENLGCRFRDFARKLAKRYASSIVVLTEEDRKQYLETPAHAQIVRIPNAVPEMTAADSPEIPEEPFLLSVGRLDYQKGMDRIPVLAEQVFSGHPEWKWVILGNGMYRSQILAELEKRHLADRVLLLGKRNPAPFYAKAQMLVMPSRYEGFPMVLLESLSSGCPAVSFACKCGPLEIIQNGKNGYLIPPENLREMAGKIRFLMEHPEIRRDFAGNAPESMKPFSASAFLCNWEKLLNQ